MNGSLAHTVSTASVDIHVLTHEAHFFGLRTLFVITLQPRVVQCPPSFGHLRLLDQARIMCNIISVALSLSPHSRALIRTCVLAFCDLVPLLDSLPVLILIWVKPSRVQWNQIAVVASAVVSAAIVLPPWCWSFGCNSFAQRRWRSIFWYRVTVVQW